MDVVKTALFKENIFKSGRGWNWQTNGALHTTTWTKQLMSKLKERISTSPRSTDIKQSLNKISLLQLILSIKTLKLSSIDLYENKDWKYILIYRQSDRQ